MRKVNPKIDLVFKKLFGTEQNKDLLMSLVNSILPENQKINSITLKNPYNEIDFPGDKLSVLDIKAADDKGIWYDIEIQIQGHDYYGRRALFYWAELYTNQLEQSENFDCLCKSISINLLDFVYFGDDQYKRRICLKDFDTNEIYEYLDYQELYFIELKKFNKDLQFVNTALERWITFLNKARQWSRDTIPMELANDKEIVKAVEAVERMSLTKKERDYYEGREKFVRDQELILKSAINKATAEATIQATIKGKIEGKIEVAKGLKTDGIPFEIIAKNTGLTIDEIENL
ncbi:MAG: Rpn family recombination-promoting nuclease/putative transposase [Bacteroidetes bacterium]|nr:Rpn family recombination-promoting nuclease/putative transposase [Bacteroidota bacterium]